LVETDSTSHLTYTDVFNQSFPYYLSIGMSYEEFWNKDVYLVKAYKKAEEYRFNRMNRDAWVQGMYIYEALADVSPVLNAFAKKGTKIRPYSKEPYAFTFGEKDKEEQSVKKQNEMFAKMKKYADRVNKYFKGKSNE
jgi:hypothetical protein